MMNEWIFCYCAQYTVVNLGVKETELLISLFGTKNFKLVLDVVDSNMNLCL